MGFLWFLIGAVIGAAIAWYFLNQKCASQLADRDREITTLKNDFAAAKANSTPKKTPQSQPVRAISKSETSQDDLTRINGIGKVLKGKLNDLGIYTFKQISELTHADIDRVNEQLSFKGRIEREKWVEQARALTGQD
jgi:predicted flap endonuclease-1-like 5' DNA nuclease